MGSGSARMAFALKDLRERWDEATALWSDVVAQEFEKEPPGSARTAGEHGRARNGQDRRGPAEGPSGVFRMTTPRGVGRALLLGGDEIERPVRLKRSRAVECEYLPMPHRGRQSPDGGRSNTG